MMPTHRCHLECLEARSLMAADALYGSALLALDTTGDGVIAPADALRVVEGLNTWGSAAWNAEGEARSNTALFRRLDANSDQAFTPLDALTIINRINQAGSESVTFERLAGTAFQQLTPEQRQAIDQLFRGLNAIRADSNLTCDQVISFVTDVVALLDGATQPSQDQLDALKASLVAAIADRDISAAEIDQLKMATQQFLLSMDIDPAAIEQFTARWQTLLTDADFSAADLDDVLDAVEGLVNAFAPGALNLPSSDLLFGQLDSWIHLLPDLLDSPTLSADSPVGFQQIAAHFLGTFSGSDVLRVLGSPADTADLSLISSASALSQMIRWK